MEEKIWTVSRSKEILATPHWLAHRDRCKTLRGHEIDYYYIERANSAHIIAFTEEKKIVFVRQYRHPQKKWLLEIPAGILNDKESPKDGVKRELLEETGYSVSDIKSLGEVLIAPGLLSQRMFVYVGFCAEKIHEPRLDESEDAEAREYSLEEARELAARGEIIDGPTLAGLFLAREYIERQGFPTSLRQSLLSV